MRNYQKKLIHSLISVFLLLAALPATVLRVHAIEPVGDAYPATPHSTFAKARSAVAASKMGAPYAIWSDEEQDGDQFGIYGRVLPTGPQTNLNTTKAGRQNWPAVGLTWDLSEGIVAWEEQGGNRPSGIFGRALADIPMSPEFRISQDETHTMAAPAVAFNQRGSAGVAVWHSLGQDGFYGGIYGRRVTAGGEARGDEFQINTYTAGSELVPDVAMAYDGRFVVTWFSWTGTGHEGIYAQRYDKNFNRVGEEMEIANFSRLGDLNHYALAPAIAMDPAGNFVIAWSIGPHTDFDTDIYARRYHADGTPTGPAFQVNHYAANVQAFVDVAMDQRGNSLFVWQSDGQDGSSYGIYSRLYDGAGTPVGDEFLVNTLTTGYQVQPAVDMSDVGQWVVTWTSQGIDGTAETIYARAYRHQFPTFTVNSTVDPGDGLCTFDECTLREVLAEALTNPGTETIAFAIPGEGPHTINLSSLLVIRSPVILDGYTQPGARPNTNTVEQGLNTVLKVAIRGGIELRHNITVKGLALSSGIDVYQNNSIFEGNFIGVDVSGMAATSGGIALISGGGNLQIGGIEPAKRNLIVGRVSAGTFGSIGLQGNLMGTDITGMRALGPGAVVGNEASITVGGAHPQARNLLTSVSLGLSSGTIMGNYIGVDVTGMNPLGNGGSIQSALGAGFNAVNNLLAYTAGTPIVIGNSGRLSGNRIFNNGGLGIDVGNDGVSLNDPGDLNSTGAGGKQNFPIINWAHAENGETVLEGILDSKPTTNYNLEFFANVACDPSGFGEGERVLGTATLTTDANGKGTFRVRFPSPPVTGESITAIATGLGNTSEFGPCQVMGAALLNSLLTLNGYTATYNPTPVPNAPAGVYTLSATFTNRTTNPIQQLYYRIVTLTGKNLLLNAQGGPTGEGGVIKAATMVTPSASFTMNYAIGLQQKAAFTFLVDAYGLADGIAATATAGGFGHSVTDAALETAGATNPIYLPFVAR